MLDLQENKQNQRKYHQGSIHMPDIHMKRQVDLSITRRTNDISQKVGLKWRKAQAEPAPMQREDRTLRIKFCGKS